MEARRGENKERYQGMRVWERQWPDSDKEESEGGERGADVADIKTKGYLSTC